MNEQLPEHHSYQISKNRFVMMIIGTIGISLLLVAIAMALYASSGAAQVDLSRPGYKDIRNQAKGDDPSFDGFPGVGTINKSALEEFQKLFSKQANDATSVKAFDTDVLSDSALRIEAE
ncbi:MAG: hypothetical protein ABJA64_02925 [Candidatus Saccharibacteria bacterium]